MQIGFINFSQEELARKNKVLQMVRDQTAIDELGFGRIRDAFANLMFPGMSTLQRRAKYFAVMPSLFYQACRGKHYNSVSDVRAQIIKWEINLTEMLVNGTKHNESKIKGITGSSMLSVAKREPSNFVKYDPTYIYINGLRTFGMVKSGQDIYRLIFERSKQNNEQRVRYKATDDGELSDSEDKSGLAEIFSCCEEVYDFDNGKEMSLELTKKEAEYIKNHITKTDFIKDSLLAYILLNDIEVLPEYDSLETGWSNLPKKLIVHYRMGRRFSHFAYVIQLRFNHIMAVFNEMQEDAEKLQTEIEKILYDHHQDFTEGSINEMLQIICPYVTERTVITFCKEAITLIEGRDWAGLDELIVKREKAVKPGRSKLRNPKYKGEKWDKPQMLSFRWNEIVYQVINEIREAK